MGERLLACLGASILLGGCIPAEQPIDEADPPSEDGRGGLPADQSQGLLSGTIPLQWGFVGDQWQAGWVIGDSRDQANLAPGWISEVYVFCRDSDFESCPMQTPPRGDNIFATVPKDDGYSPYWQVVRVRVPDDYVDNTIKSESLIEESGWETERLPMVVNCVIHAPFATLEDGAGVRSNLAWYQGWSVEYWDFGMVDFSDGAVAALEGYELYRDDQALSEIAIGADVNNDGDQADTNNILTWGAIGGSARIDLRRVDIESDAVSSIDVEDASTADFTTVDSLDDPSVTKGESLGFVNFALRPE